MSLDDIFRDCVNERRVVLLLRGGGKFEGVPRSIEGDSWILRVEQPEAGELRVLRSEVAGLFLPHRRGALSTTRAVEHIWREGLPSTKETRIADRMLLAIEDALSDLPAAQAKKVECLLLRSGLRERIVFEGNQLEAEFEADAEIPSRTELASLLALIL